MQSTIKASEETKTWIIESTRKMKPSEEMKAWRKMKTSEETVIKNPKGSPKNNQEFLSFR